MGGRGQNVIHLSYVIYGRRLRGAMTSSDAPIPGLAPGEVRLYVSTCPLVHLRSSAPHSLEPQSLSVR